MSTPPKTLLPSEKIPMHIRGATLPMDLLQGRKFWCCLNGLVEVCLAGVGIPVVIRIRDKGEALVIDGVRRAGPDGSGQSEKDEIPF